MIGSGKQRMRQNDAELRRTAESFEAERRAEAAAQMAEVRQAERDRVRFTREDVVGATAVRLHQRRGWFRVVRVSTHSVTVEDVNLVGNPQNIAQPFARVIEVRR